MRQPRYLWLLFLAGIVTLTGCGSIGPARSLEAGNETVYQFTTRTDRLCTGAAPVLSKAECLDRINVSDRAQKSLTAARVALAGCVPGKPCDAAKIALAALDEVLRQLEGYLYKGVK